MPKDIIEVYTVSYLTKQGDILKRYCHHDLAKANEYALSLLKSEDTGGVFIQAENISATEYIFGFGNSLSKKEISILKLEHNLSSREGVN